MLKVCHISDTHMDEMNSLPKADVLIHSGDYSFQYKTAPIEKKRLELVRLNKWFKSMRKKYKKIIFVPGNHDFIFEMDEQLARQTLSEAVVLIDEEYVFEGVKFYGTPSQPPFANWAFNHMTWVREAKFAMIPEDTDVLITHCPPYGILDELSYPPPPDWNPHVGCEVLAEELKRIKPVLHCFGHIHEAYGTKEIDGTIYSNASRMNLRYSPTNKPMVFEIRSKNELQD